MANNFFENLRSVVGVEKRPWETQIQRIRFPQSMRSYDGREQSLKNLDAAERNFGISDRSETALMDRGAIDKNDVIPIPLKEVRSNVNGQGLKVIPGNFSLPKMDIWRMDGRPFNLNSYLGSIQKIKDEIRNATDRGEILKALKKGSNEWGMNIHALGHQFSRQQDVPDITPRVILENYIKWALEDAENLNTEELKEALFDGIEVDMVPADIRGGKLT